MIVGISPDRLTSVWHTLAPKLKKAFDRVDYPFSLDEVLEKITSTDMQLWMTHDARMAWVTRILVFPRYKVFEVVAGGGEGMEDWLEDSDRLFTAFASHHGCKYVEVQGRKGWEKVATPLGYGFGWVTLRKEV